MHEFFSFIFLAVNLFRNCTLIVCELKGICICHVYPIVSVNTVNIQFFARILFLLIALKDILAT